MITRVHVCMYPHLSFWVSISYQTLKEETGHPKQEDEKMAWEKAKLYYYNSSRIDNKTAGSDRVPATCIYLSEYSMSDSMLNLFFINHLFAFLTEFFERREQSYLSLCLQPILIKWTWMLGSKACFTYRAGDVLIRFVFLILSTVLKRCS